VIRSKVSRPFTGLFIAAAALLGSACRTKQGQPIAQSDGSRVAAKPVVQLATPSIHDVPPDAGNAAYLPESVSQFVPGAIESGPGFVRRRYERGAVHVTLIVAHLPILSGLRWELWAQMSADYPAAVLNIPAGTGSGFYDCRGHGSTERCNLHIHLKNGFHVELISDATATRDELALFAESVPLRAIAMRLPMP
jgi:hypothetical protein